MPRTPYNPSLRRPVRISGVNWVGLQTLYLKEVRRFMNVPTQTLLGPVVTAVLFMMVFAVAVGERAGLGAGNSFVQFLAPGLVMMTVLQNAFANTSSSITSAKAVSYTHLTLPTKAGVIGCARHSGTYLMVRGH